MNTHRSTRTLLAISTACACLPLVSGCAEHNSKASMENADVEQFIKVMMPQKIQLLKLTRPVSFAADGNADGLEVLLAAEDSAGDNTKMAGSLLIELHQFRAASTDEVGDRIALWPIVINSAETMRLYWDRPSRFYLFPLQLPEKAQLPPGKYVLTAQLTSPVGDRLFDTYTFEYHGGAAPPVRRVAR
jgi:hypothetical protein